MDRPSHIPERTQGDNDGRAATGRRPKVSVIATVRNERQTIDAFVESLLQQSYAPDEIIIVDGGSTDGTHEMLRRYADAGKIAVISKNCNIAEGRNLAIAKASGDWIAVTDAGCVVDADWLRNLAAHFDEPPAPDVVAGNFQCRFDNSFEEAVAAATFAPGREHARQNLYPSSRSVAFRRSAWQHAQGYPEWLYAAEDTLFNIRLRQLGYRFVFARSAYVYWRPRPTWRALAKQRFNFARGNARIDFGTQGYLINIQYHLAMLLPLLAAIAWPPLALLALVPLVQHIRNNLWSQAVFAAGESRTRGMLLRVLLVMEFVRLANMFGFLAGRWDRLVDDSFTLSQIRWMGAPSIEDVAGAASGIPDSPQLGTRPGSVRPGMSGRASNGVRGSLRAIRAWAGPATAVLGVAALLTVPSLHFPIGLVIAPAIAMIITVLLTTKSMHDFSQTGPEIKKEIRDCYVAYSLLALARLMGWAFVLTAILALSGFAVYGLAVLGGFFEFRPVVAVAAAILGVLVGTALQFCRILLYLPSTIAISSHYRFSRLYPLWRTLSRYRLTLMTGAVYGLVVALSITAASGLVADGRPFQAAIVLSGIAFVSLAWFFASTPDAFVPRVAAPAKRPNVLMIGSDTLRADRLGVARYRRCLTPFIDTLATRGTHFSECYVPCARTAPSLASLFTGTWPQTHGIRDNFISDAEAQLSIPALPAILAGLGYRTAAVSDWSGGDLGKLPLGFATLDLPSDQWNIKYLLRQGPKDLRLFLSLFTRNRFGKRFLPELYYLAGIPLTSRVGADARRLITRFAEDDRPFLLNIFISTTHPPFGSEYPYYALYSDPAYTGESKFAMARLTDPWDIIRRQGDSKHEFDLDQITDLYDGCVRNFDAEVQRIVAHLEACGLADNTIVVIYSDHGMEFFEHETWGQGNSVRSDFSARIPLIIVDPRLTAGTSCPRVVRSIDVAPTLLELLGIAAPEAWDGASIVPYLKGDHADMNLPAFNETGIWLTDLPGTPAKHLRYPELLDLLEVPDKRTGTLAIKPTYREAIIAAKDRMVRVGAWKLTYQPTSDGPLYALFNVSTDPDCRNDVAAEHPEVLHDLRTRLNQWIAGRGPGGLERAGGETAAVFGQGAAKMAPAVGGRAD